MTIRKFKEGIKEQGIDERVGYKIDTIPWGGSPSNAAVAIVLRGEDVSEDHLEGGITVDGNVIITPLVVGLESGNKYRLEVKWDCQSNTFEAYGFIITGGIY